MKIGSERGVALVMVLIMLSVMTIIGLGITGIGMVATAVTINAGETASAVAVADAGIAHARRLLMWREWPSLNPFLQNAGGTACDGDELSAAPAMPLPAGYPALASDYIPAAGVAFGGGTYRVFVCDDHVTDFDPATGALDGDPNFDVNRRILVRSLGIGANGATATVEQVFGSVDVPAVIVNGNVLATGNPKFMGAAGAIHANGSMQIAGNPCAQQYFSAVGPVPVTGGSAGGGTGCAPGSLDTRPDSPPVNTPLLTPDMYKAQADYWLESNGTAYNGLTGAPIAVPASWTFNAGSQTWASATSIPAGTYWINGNVVMGGSPGSAGSPLPLTILARGYVDVGGSPRTTPDLIVNNLGANPVGLSVVTGTDLRLAGSSTQTFTGIYHASHQLDVSGSPVVNGQMIALNQADTPYPAAGPATNNLIQLNAAGQMVISGSPTVNFAGNGIQALRALQWRECRTLVNPADPCGPLFGG